MDFSWTREQDEIYDTVLAQARERLPVSNEDLVIVFSVAAHLSACAMPPVEEGNETVKATLLPGLCSAEIPSTIFSGTPEMRRDSIARELRL